MDKLQIKIKSDNHHSLIKFKMFINKIEFLFPGGYTKYVNFAQLVRLKSSISYRQIIKNVIQIKFLIGDIVDR